MPGSMPAVGARSILSDLPLADQGWLVKPSLNHWTHARWLARPWKSACLDPRALALSRHTAAIPHCAPIHAL
jgi:hypothetical protein